MGRKKHKIETNHFFEGVDKTKIEKLFNKWLLELYNTLNKEKNKDILENLKVKFNIIFKKEIFEGKEQRKMYIEVEDWLPQWLIIKNPWFFLDFLYRNSLIPVLKDIKIISWEKEINISKLNEFKKLLGIFKLFYIINWEIPYHLYNELEKLYKNIKSDIFKDITLNDLITLGNTIKTIIDLIKRQNKVIGKNFEKIKNKSANFTESIFLQIAGRYENRIRDIYPKITSTYLIPATFLEDTEGKTDFWFITSIKNEPIKIPIQLKSTSDLKQPKYESRLPSIIKKLNQWTNSLQINLFNNWDIKYVVLITHSRIWGNQQIEDLYHKRITDKNFRIKTSMDKFPFFINILSENDIIELKLTYLLLHLIPYLKIRKKIKNTHVSNKTLRELENILKSSITEKLKNIFIGNETIDLESNITKINSFNIITLIFKRKTTNNMICEISLFI